MTSSAAHRPYRGVAAAERIGRRRAVVMDAALEVFGSSGGYADASINTVCAEAGLTKRYFYESFDTLEALLIAVYEDANTRVRAKVQTAIEAMAGDGGPAVVAAAGVTAFLKALDEDRRLARVMFREVLGVSQRVDRAYFAVIETWEADIAAVIGELTVPGVRPDLLVTTAWGLVTGLTVRWVLSDFSEPVDELATSTLVILSRILGG